MRSSSAETIAFIDSPGGYGRWEPNSMGWRPPRSTSVPQRPCALTVRALAKDRSALSFLRFPARDCADSPGNAAGGLFERLQILLAGLPQDGRIRFVVFVAENVADTSDRSPRDMCFAFFQLF